MKIGLIYVAFGSGCDKLAAHCVAYSRKYTQIPITVLTNIPAHLRSTKWQSVSNIEFKYFDMPVGQNRHIKTTLPEHSPYDYTIYMDADSIIQKEGFDELITSMAELGPDLILNHFCTYPYPDKKFQNIYLRAFKKFECAGPLLVYNGAFIGFKNTENAKLFFSTWHKYWKEFGAQREMPPLACAINNLPLVTVMDLPAGFFCPDHKDDNATVQHNYHEDFYSRIGTDPIELAQASYGVDDYKFTVVE